MERTVYRIIDANFNRAREAIRTMEDFCRFALNSEILTRQAKQFRHALCAVINELEAVKLIAARDSTNDVAAALTVDNQLQRKTLKDSFTAASKRLTEALRTLAEAIKTIKPSVAEKIEKLRFTAYSLEKDIVLAGETMEKFKKVRLYLIITSRLPAEIISLTSRCANAGPDCIQLRAKDIPDATLFAVAVEFVKICKEAGILSIINDRMDIAAACAADGVHLGQDDLPVEYARKLSSYPLIIGKSTHCLRQLQLACRQLPTYLSLGPVFATATKPAVEPVGLDYVEQGTRLLADTGIGHAAVGGITADNIKQVLTAGAKTIAVCSAITNAADPVAACRNLKEKISAFGA